jgi:hypothetical protein
MFFWYFIILAASMIPRVNTLTFLYKPLVGRIKMPHHYFVKTGKGRAAG